MRVIKCLTVTMLALASLPAVARDSGDPWTAHYMWRRYFNTAEGCDSAKDKAAYLCTGIIMRGTHPGEARHVWWPENKSLPGTTIASGGVSFSYIRSDIPAPKAGWFYKNGFTVFPQTGKYAVQGKIPLKVLCSFPTDAGTDIRNKEGCGATTDYPGVSMACEDQNIKTAQQWIQKYPGLPTAIEHPNPPQIHFICGFNTRSDTRAAFQPVLDIFHTLGKNPGIPYYNEMRIGSWTPDDATSKVFPIESFFYMAGSAEGLQNARYDQADFYSTTKQFVPIVKVTFPVGRDDKFDFSYNKADQNPAVPRPKFPDKDPLPCEKKDGADMKC